MKNIDKMIRCRTIFLDNVSMMLDDDQLFLENVAELLHGFFCDYFDSYRDLFSMLYYFEYDEDGVLCFYDEDDWVDMMKYYLMCIRSSASAREIYNGIDSSEFDKIIMLSEMFYNYILDTLYTDINIRRREKNERE